MRCAANEAIMAPLSVHSCGRGNSAGSGRPPRSVPSARFAQPGVGGHPTGDQQGGDALGGRWRARWPFAVDATTLATDGNRRLPPPGSRPPHPPAPSLVRFHVRATAVFSPEEAEHVGIIAAARSSRAREHDGVVVAGAGHACRAPARRDNSSPSSRASLVVISPAASSTVLPSSMSGSPSDRTCSRWVCLVRDQQAHVSGSGPWSWTRRRPTVRPHRWLTP